MSKREIFIDFSEKVDNSDTVNSNGVWWRYINVTFTIANLGVCRSFDNAKMGRLCMSRKVLALGNLILCFIAAPAAMAAEIPWKTNTYRQTAANRPVAEILRDFAADQGVSIVVSQKIAGTFSGQFGPMPPSEFLMQISQTGGLIWYFDGQALYVYRSDEIQSQVVKLQFTDAQKVTRSLDQLGISTKRFPLKTIPEDGGDFVSGPPRYVELVGKTIEMLESSGRSKADVDLAVGVYRLHHAWADDRTYYLRDRQITVPGVASILRNVLGGQRQGQKSATGESVKQLPQSVPGLLGKGLASTGREPQGGLPSALQPGSKPPEPPAGEGSETAAPGGEASVQADSRLNAVVVRDTREKLPAYEAIIRSLDQPGGLVEITANIIDIDTDCGFEWAPPDMSKWKFDGRDNIAAFSITSPETGAPAGHSTGNFTASLTSGGATQFFQSVKLLQTNGDAHFVARPKVLTINNVEAFLDNTETVYVKVQGAYATDLYNVQVGTMLQITPHIVEKDGSCRVQLIVEVRDGNFVNDQKVDGVPRVKQNTINTQAILDEGCSLLIGGLRRTEKQHAEKRIPFLGGIPVVGNLFKTVSDTSKDYDRVVLISPRIIDLPPPQALPSDSGPRLQPEVIPAPEAAPLPESISRPARQSGRRYAVPR